MRTVNACCVLLLAVALSHTGSSTFAQGSSGPRLSQAGQDWEEWRTRAGSADGVPRPENPTRQPAAGERSKSTSAGAAAERRAHSAAGAVAKALGSREKIGEGLRQMEKEAGRRGFVQAERLAREVRDVLERVGALDRSDDDYKPPPVPDGQPDVPSSCEGNPECRECYGSALDRLDATRYRLERLRAIYASTVKDAKAKVAFADGVSTVHGVSALAWQKYKIGVTQSLSGLDRAYDAKYAELMGTLLEDLRGVSVCEDTIMHVPDWYDRFGFIYYTFMKDRYKRPTL